MKRFILVFLLALLSAGVSFGQTSMLQVVIGTPTIKVVWEYTAAEESMIDDFQVQRTGIDTASSPTGSFGLSANIPKASRVYTFTIPAGVVVGAKGYFRLVARKTGVPDSAPSNVVGIEIMPLPPVPAPLAAPRNVTVVK